MALNISSSIKIPTNESFTINKRLISADANEKEKKEERDPFTSPSPLLSEWYLELLSRSEEAKATAASAYAAASAVLSIGQRRYCIPPGKNIRYAARGYVYPTRRAAKAAKAAATIDASVGEETTAPSTWTSILTPEDDRYWRLLPWWCCYIY